MKTNRPIHVLLAGIGLASLLVYVLACSTAFSPDDRQVLYPSFDPQSGALSFALYDRKSGRSEHVFSGMQLHADTNFHSSPMRAEWMPDGKHILVAQADEKDRLSLTLLPRGVAEPIRHFGSIACQDATMALQFPFAVAGHWVFLNQEHGFVRLDLRTGEGVTTTNLLAMMPNEDGKTIVGWREAENDSGEFGLVNPQTLEFQSKLIITNSIKDGTFPIFNSQAHEAIFIAHVGTNQEFQVQRDGQKTFSRLISRPGYDVKVASIFLALGPGKDRAFTTYLSQTEGQTNYECGLLEIPLSEKPLRFTPLFSVKSDEMVALLAQPSLSHDGRTWAISSAWLGVKDKSNPKPEDCALFLVEVDRRLPKVTKVPIVQPNVRDEGMNF